MKIRLFIAQKFSKDLLISPSKEQLHYLKNVLRLKNGAELYLFNNQQGEFLANYQNGQLHLVKQTQDFYQVPNIALAFAPVKNVKSEYLVTKATELGVREIFPINTERTIVNRINLEKLEKNSIEAAEQSRRVDLPQINQLEKLPKFIAALQDELLIFADESGEGESPQQLAQQVTDFNQDSKIVVLIGPEGGFSEEEAKLIRAYQHTKSLNLGPRILRADTAIISSLAIIQSIYGDTHIASKSAY